MSLEVKGNFNEKFDILKDIKLNGGYEGFKVKVNEIFISDKLLGQRVESEFRRQVPKIEVTDRLLQEDDYASIEFEAVDENNVKVENASGSLTFQVGKKRIYPEIEECVKTLNKDDSGKARVKFSANHPSFPNKELQFTIKLVKIEETPQFNDASVKNIKLPGIDTVDQYTEKIRKQLFDSEKQKRDYEIKSSLQEQIGNLVNSEDLPEFLIEANVNMSYEQFLKSLEIYGLGKNDYFEKTGQTEENFKETLKKEAILELRLTIALSKIAAEKGFEVSAEELQKEKEKLMKEYQIKEEEFEEKVGGVQLEESLKMRKALEYVQNSAIIIENSESPAEIEK
ncbi:MAG: hypothetical protein LBJ32_02605 [Oscillospiraceae bacterium]|jgi:trigger factor|nr:hypothetical protein [Oscillospiraceae bacterium]